MLGAWRFRRHVLARMDFIFSSMGPSMAKDVLRANFGRKWKAVLDAMYDEGLKPDEAAANGALVSLRGIVTKVSDDDRALALHAIRTENRASSLANHLRSIHGGIALYGKKAVADAASYEIIGLLEGKTGEDLDSYRTKRMIEDVLRL